MWNMCVIICAVPYDPASHSLSVPFSGVCCCRSRLADYLVNCWMPAHTVSICPNQDNHQACLASYARLIGQCSRARGGLTLWWSGGVSGSEAAGDKQTHTFIPTCHSHFLKLQIHGELKSDGYRELGEVTASCRTFIFITTGRRRPETPSSSLLAW